MPRTVEQMDRDRIPMRDRTPEEREATLGAALRMLKRTLEVDIPGSVVTLAPKYTTPTPETAP